MSPPSSAEWLEQIAEYWREEHPERDFERVRALLALGRLSFQMPAFEKQMQAMSAQMGAGAGGLPPNPFMSNPQAFAEAQRQALELQKSNPDF